MYFRHVTVLTKRRPLTKARVISLGGFQTRWMSKNRTWSVCDLNHHQSATNGSATTGRFGMDEKKGDRPVPQTAQSQSPPTPTEFGFGSRRRARPFLTGSVAMPETTRCSRRFHWGPSKVVRIAKKEAGAQNRRKKQHTTQFLR